MMNSASRSLFASAALAVVLAGCQRSDLPAMAKGGAPPQSEINAAQVSQKSKGDPSVPDAASALPAQDAPDKTKAMQDTTGLQQNAVPQETMTKDEESKAMPLPGQ